MSSLSQVGPVTAQGTRRRAPRPDQASGKISSRRVSSDSIMPLKAPQSRWTQRRPARSAMPITVVAMTPASATSALPGSATTSTA